MSPSNEVTAVRALIEKVAHDAELSPARRTRELSQLRSDLEDLIGQADGYLDGNEKDREGVAVAGRYNAIKARQRASIREELMRNGEASRQQLDDIGYLSHDQLDQASADGTLEATLASG